MKLSIIASAVGVAAVAGVWTAVAVEAAGSSPTPARTQQIVQVAGQSTTTAASTTAASSPASSATTATPSATITVTNTATKETTSVANQEESPTQDETATPTAPASSKDTASVIVGPIAPPGGVVHTYQPPVSGSPGNSQP